MNIEKLNYVELMKIKGGVSTSSGNCTGSMCKSGAYLCKTGAVANPG